MRLFVGKKISRKKKKIIVFAREKKEREKEKGTPPLSSSLFPLDFPLSVSYCARSLFVERARAKEKKSLLVSPFFFVA